MLNTGTKPEQPSWRDTIAGHPWLIFLMPLLVFMIVGTLEPSPDKPGGAAIGLAIPYAFYPAVYAVKIALTVVAFVLIWPGYRRFPFRIGPLGLAVGALGAAVWIGLCTLRIEQTYLASFLPWLGDLGVRSGFNPLGEISSRCGAWSFLIVRLLGLVVVVPLAEEMFYRGFLMPFFVRHDWWTVPQGQTNRAGVALSVIAPLLLHPGELIAAAVWFSMVTWLFLRTRNVWDCVAAHATTNLILGIYVLSTGNWWLW